MVDTAPQVLGPGWSPSGLNVYRGRYPLAVEAHVGQLVALLVPGVTAVTTLARYFALHALIAVKADRGDWNVSDTLDRLRRSEVVLSAVSALHEHPGFPAPHGGDKIAPRLAATDSVDVAWLSQPGKDRYATGKFGFWGAYFGSELSLGILAYEGRPSAGPRLDGDAVTSALDGLLELAEHDVLTKEELAGASHLCLCQMAAASDGKWLRRLQAATQLSEDDETKPDRARRGTVRLLSRVLQIADGGTVTDFVSAFQQTLAFGPFVRTDAVASTTEVADVWQGALLRHYSVGAWRRIWAWMVQQINGLATPTAIADAVADAMPAGTVADLIVGVPATRSPAGDPLPAEDHLRASADNIPTRELKVLAAGAKRASELVGRAGDAFRGRPVELSPEWMSARLQREQHRPATDFGRDLARDLLVRAQRVAMNKMVRRSDGTIGLPTRVYERGGFLYKIGDEGAGDVGLRIGSLGLVLAGAGMFEHTDAGWTLTESGQATLG